MGRLLLDTRKHGGMTNLQTTPTAGCMTHSICWSWQGSTLQKTYALCGRPPRTSGAPLGFWRVPRLLEAPKGLWRPLKASGSSQTDLQYRRPPKGPKKASRSLPESLGERDEEIGAKPGLSTMLLFVSYCIRCWASQTQVRPAAR